MDVTFTNASAARARVVDFTTPLIRLELGLLVPGSSTVQAFDQVDQAGMRVGVMIASPAVLAPIRKVMPLFNLNVVAVAALRAAIADPSFRSWYMAQAAESKALIYAACERAGLKYWKSAANFVLIDGGAKARQIIDAMIAEGVFVRDRTKDPSTPTCFRITTGVVALIECFKPGGM